MSEVQRTVRGSILFRFSDYILFHQKNESLFFRRKRGKFLNILRLSFGIAHTPTSTLLLPFFVISFRITLFGPQFSYHTFISHFSFLTFHITLLVPHFSIHTFWFHTIRFTLLLSHFCFQTFIFLVMFHY